ncbi:MAG: hypothetical protein ABJR05_07520 [Balneola sp.]
MKKSITLVPLLFLLMATTINSQNREQRIRQEPAPVKERVETILKKFNTELTLTEKQIKSSEEILTDFFTSTDELRKTRSRDSRSKLESLTKKRDEDIEALLTESQLKKFNDIKEELFPRRRRPNN